jgi:hypothetical protein
VLAYSIFHDLAAETSGEKELALNTTVEIMNNILDHNFTLTDVNGQQTRWGFWNPQALNDDPLYPSERGPYSVQILSHLLAAHRLCASYAAAESETESASGSSEQTGSSGGEGGYYTTLREKYKEAFLYLAFENGYAHNMLNQVAVTPGEINYSDVELSFLPFYSMSHACRDQTTTTTTTTATTQDDENAGGGSGVGASDNAAAVATAAAAAAKAAAERETLELCSMLAPWAAASMEHSYSIASRQHSALWDLIYGAFYSQSSVFTEAKLVKLSRTRRTTMTRRTTAAAATAAATRPKKTTKTSLRARSHSVAGVGSAQRASQKINEEVVDGGGRDEEDDEEGWQQQALATLLDYPDELVRWDVDNTKRADLWSDPNLLPTLNQSVNSIARSESGALEWCDNPYSFAWGGGGMSEANPVFFLIAYWVGRYHGFVPAEL